MAAFEAGSWVWFADEDDGFLPGQVTSSFHAGEVGSVTLQDGEVVNFDAKQSADLRQMDIQVRPRAGWCHVRHNGALLDPSSDHANQVPTLRMESWMHGLLRVRGGWDGAGSLSLRPEWRFIRLLPSTRARLHLRHATQRRRPSLVFAAISPRPPRSSTLHSAPITRALPAPTPNAPHTPPHHTPPPLLLLSS